MDFSYLMGLASQNNEEAKNQDPKRCLSTKFSKPKKLERSMVKSDAIKKFLAKRESEDQRKVREAAEKKEKLLNLRAQEKGTKRRVNAMVKRNKAANKSVLEDAKDQYNTAATVDGCYQPDTDDYGYVSKEAEQMYSRLLQRYDQLPGDEYRRDQAKHKTVTTDLSATKARVKESLDTQDIEQREAESRRRKRKKDGNVGEAAVDSPSAPDRVPSSTTTTSDPSCSQRKEGRQKGPQPPRQQAPPPGLDFCSILRLAAEKQNQPPVALNPQPDRRKNPDSERPMTASQRQEAELERVRRLRKLGKLPPARSAPPAAEPTKSSSAGGSEKSTTKTPSKKSGEQSDRACVKKPDSSARVPKSRPEDKPATPKLKTKAEVDPKTSVSTSRADVRSAGGVGGMVKRPAEKLTPSASTAKSTKPSPNLPIKPRYAPPTKSRPVPPAKKARVIDSDSEEYDSEMDDFIDDGPLPGEQDYSSAIKEIFGYDKSKFRDEDDNCSDMEADFGTVMKEERRSAKIAQLEDEEEFRKEIAHKKRKMALKSKFW